jgi:hypothetical protein
VLFTVSTVRNTLTQVIKLNEKLIKFELLRNPAVIEFYYLLIIASVNHDGNISFTFLNK